MASEILRTCGRLLAQKELTVAFAESATAGRLAAEFSLLADSGKILRGGIVCYDAMIKQKLFGVSEETLKKYTPESAEVTSLLAHSLDKLIPSDVQIAVTGLTTPGGSENPEKPVGTIFIHLLIRGEDMAIRQVFSGSPEQIVLQVVDRAASALTEHLSK